MMTLREKQNKFWHMFALLKLKADELGQPFIVTEWMRTIEQQRINVARGVSKTLLSRHLMGLAVDIAFMSDITDNGKIDYTPEQYKVLGEYWESIGGRWGGRFGDDLKTIKIEGWDAGHFELGINNE